MRLDIFLKLSRLLPRRSLAQEFIKKGLVSVNGIVAKSSKEISVGDEIEIRKYNRIRIARVIEVPKKKQVSKKDSEGLIKVISDKEIEDTLLDN